jgi:RNA polymerase sigma factor (sigma-70 family)
VSGVSDREPRRPHRAPQRGDEPELFARYGDRLVRVVQRAIGAPRHIAEDACSLAWLQLLRFQPERGSIFAWLRVVATREALRLLRSQGRHAPLVEDPVEPEPAHTAKTDLELTVEVLEALERIAALTPQQVRIFSLHLGGLSYGEISRATGYTTRTVERHVMRARKKLRNHRA